MIINLNAFYAPLGVALPYQKIQKVTRGHIPIILLNTPLSDCKLHKLENAENGYFRFDEHYKIINELKECI